MNVKKANSKVEQLVRSIALQEKNDEEKMTYEFSLVLPAYNEAESLPHILKEYEKEKKKLSFQLVVVNNGSKDNTAEILDKLTKIKKYSFVKVVTIKKNIGYGNGIYKGLLQTNAPVIGWTHADFQTPTKDAFKAYTLYQKAKNKKILIKGNRRKRTHTEELFSKGLEAYASILLFKNFDDINGQPKVFSKDLLKTCKKPPKEFAFDIYMQYQAMKAGYTIQSFKVSFVERKYGVSSWANSVSSRMKLIKKYMIDIYHMKTRQIR